VWLIFILADMRDGLRSLGMLAENIHAEVLVLLKVLHLAWRKLITLRTGPQGPPGSWPFSLVFARRDYPRMGP
jgi:hypothetical protein